MKFGGSSVATADRIKHVVDIIKNYADKKPIVVLSAMGDTTDFLLDAADQAVTGVVDISQVEKLHLDTMKELGVESDEIKKLLDELQFLLTGISMLRELTKRTRDYLVSFGERLSVRMAALYMQKIGIPAQFYDAWDIGFISNSDFMSAELLDEVWQNIPKSLENYAQGSDTAIPIVTGFIAKDKKGYITTLGRGGSDLTATMIGAALKVEEVQTWKDVDGILTTDPRVVSQAKSVPMVTYDEAAELAFFGAQVLHPRSMHPCRKTGTPVRVKNSYNITSEGSLIVEKHTDKPTPVRAITTRKGVTLIDIVSTRMLGQAGFLAHVFNHFLKWDISVDMVATSEVSVSLTVNSNKNLEDLREDLEKVASTNIKENKSIISIICDIKHSSEILEKAFEALQKAGINVQMISQGASKVNISLICEDSEANIAVQALHKTFFEL